MKTRFTGFDDPRPRKPWPDFERDWPRLIAKAVIAESGCWLWQAGKNKKGYGIFGTGEKRPNGSAVCRGAHACAYVLHHGLADFPALCVLHRCDNPGCINPEHLFLGTKADNNQDMRDKGRGRVEHLLATAALPGEKHWNASLTEAQVVEIRCRRAAGERNIDVARAFGTTPAAVSSIAHGRTWPHAPGPICGKDY